MAQQRRMIYSSIFANAELNMLAVEERLLYMGTIVFADDDGKLRADPRYLKGLIFPFDEKITALEVEKGLKNLSNLGQVLVYERDGVKVLKHPKWAKYQRIRADLHVPSKLPSPLRASNEAVTSELLNISKDNISKDNIAAPAAKDFSLEEEIKKLEDSPRRDLNIIALFLEHRKPDLKTYDQFQVALSRHLRPAKSLKSFDNNQLLDGFAKAKKSTGEWTLETVVKMLTK